MDGVQESASNEFRLSKSKKIDVLSNDLQRIKEICQGMPREIRSDFEGSYGRIMDLLHVPLETAVLSALAQFWNSSLRCFELPSLDLVPTIEEYEKMLGLPIQKPGVYLYRGSLVSAKRVADLIDLPTKQAKLKGIGLGKGWNKAVLEDHLANLAIQGKWKSFQKTLALIIYGLVLFPFKFEMIDQGAMDVFYLYDTQKINPIPAILAETFLSMEVCSQKDEAMLRCCPQLLYVWFVTHMFASNHLGYAPDPLKSFYRVPMKKQAPKEWKKELSQFKADHFPWVCPWYHPGDIIFKCGDFSNVPLMGPRGCVAYTPAIALRQLKWTQVVPRERELGGLSFQYGPNGSNGPQEEVRVAWKRIIRKGEKELGKPRVTSSSEYQAWRKNRGVPTPIPHETPHREESSQSQSEALASLNTQVECMRAQMRLIEEREEHAKIAVEALKRECQKKDREIEHLMNESADAYSNHAKRRRQGRGKEVENPALGVMQEKIEAMKSEMTRILGEKEQLEARDQTQKQRIDILEESLSRKHAEADKWLDMAREYLHAKTLTDQNEGQLIEQIENLIHESDKLKVKVQMSEIARKESEDGWKVVVKHHQDKTNECRKECENMALCLQDHATNLAAHVSEANEEVNTNEIQLPWKTFKLVRFCENLTRNFM